MTAYLITNPPRVRQFRERGTTISGVVVVHTAESYPDEAGPDTGAESVARFIQQRTTYGSYHRLCDSDSIVNLVPLSMQAYGDGTGTNPHAMHVSAATQAAKWPSLSKSWIEETVENMALAAHEFSDELERVHGVRIPARRVTKAQSTSRTEGFISHGERDPGRRYDPGASFPWGMFMEAFQDFEAPKVAKPVKVRPTRGGQVDAALVLSRKAAAELDKARGGGARGDALEHAEKQLRQARRALRAVSYVGDPS